MTADSNPTQPGRLLRTFTRRYAASFGALALLATAKYAAFELASDAAEAALDEFNAAARQRMYSQRVGLLAQAYIEAEGDVQADVGERLRSAAVEMMEAHEALLAGVAEDAWGQADDRLRSIYFEPPNDLDARVRDFVQHAVTLAAKPGAGPGDPDLAEIQADAQGDLLLILESTVVVYGDMSTAQRDALANVNRAAYLGILLALGLIAFAVFRPMAQVIRDEESRRTAADTLQAEQRARADFASRLHAALTAVEGEEEVSQVVAHALSTLGGDSPAELLLADSSRAHLVRAVAHPGDGPAGCPVESPDRCLAVRLARTVVCRDSDDLDACVRLRGRPAGKCGGVCVPVTIAGRAAGVLHTQLASGLGASETQVSRLEILATEAANRLGSVRSLAEAQLQAATDPLTGLSNRRALAAAVAQIVRDGTPYTACLLDLDHFKRLNDTHGHEAGDKALRVFARVMGECARTGDVLARFGGEEFALVLPRVDEGGAALVIDRLRRATPGAGGFARHRRPTLVHV